jgi:hypothetical protein
MQFLMQLECNGSSQAPLMLDQQVEVCLYDFKMQVLSSTAVKDICV